MKKIFAIILLLTLTCGLLAGCAQNDEESVKNVVMAFYQAGYDWDYQTLQDCVAPEVPVYDPYESAKSTYLEAVANGFLVEADVDKFMALEKDFNQKLGEAIEYRNWNITISADTATVILTVTGAGVDFESILTADGEFAYRDEMFQELCGMDELTAKASLSPEEFSAVHLKVQEKEYQLWSENFSASEETLENQLRKINGNWKIANILPVE